MFKQKYCPSRERVKLFQGFVVKHGSHFLHQQPVHHSPTHLRPHSLFVFLGEKPLTYAFVIFFKHPILSKSRECTVVWPLVTSCCSHQRTGWKGNDVTDWRRTTEEKKGSGATESGYWAEMWKRRSWLFDVYYQSNVLCLWTAQKYGMFTSQNQVVLKWQYLWILVSGNPYSDLNIQLICLFFSCGKGVILVQGFPAAPFVFEPVMSYGSIQQVKELSKDTGGAVWMSGRKIPIRFTAEFLEKMD